MELHQIKQFHHIFLVPTCVISSQIAHMASNEASNGDQTEDTSQHNRKRHNTEVFKVNVKKPKCGDEVDELHKQLL